MRKTILFLCLSVCILAEAQVSKFAFQSKAPITKTLQIDLGRGASSTTNIVNRIDGVTANKYYLNSTIAQNPLQPDVILQVSGEWALGHVWSSSNKIILQKSTNRGRTWSSATTFYETGDPDLGVIDCGGGFSSEGRFHEFIGVHGGTAEGGTSASPHNLIYAYTDDNGETVTTTDLTAVLPSDGLNSFRFYGNLVEADGYLFFPYYKFTNEGDISSSTRYILKKPLSGGSWSSIAVSSATATYINEASIEYLGGNYLIYIARNESTKEWTLYISSDLGETWSDLGDLSFGEALSMAGPVRLSKFYIDGTLVIACYYPDRQNGDLKVIYGLASSIIADGVSGFDTDTKTTIYNHSAADTYYHYGSVLHYDNNFNALASYALEPGTTNEGVKCYLDIFHVQTSHYNTIKTELGL